MEKINIAEIGMDWLRYTTKHSRKQNKIAFALLIGGIMRDYKSEIKKFDLYDTINCAISDAEHERYNCVHSDLACLSRILEE